MAAGRGLADAGKVLRVRHEQLVDAVSQPDETAPRAAGPQVPLHQEQERARRRQPGQETLELRDHIVRMRDTLGLTILVIEHDMRVVKGVSDRVVACDYGKKIAEGSYDEVAGHERVIEAYLGTKAVG